MALRHMCTGGEPLAVRCSAVDGTPWHKTGQVFAKPCGLTGLRCQNEDNLPGANTVAARVL